MRRRAKSGVSQRLLSVSKPSKLRGARRLIRFLITFDSSSQSVDRNLKKTECEESECALEMENNEIVIHDA